ncbi:MAG: hypothetical protein A2136_01065 [Chloroflexi bacterium RBG_16_54_11]|nr:MAG: hypothetical protein A2136_01065 [Chloroflexi bacterium RBG_16_54_11]
MMIFGWFIMLLVIAIPIVLVILLLGGAELFSQNSQAGGYKMQSQFPVRPINTAINQVTTSASRYCSLCGAGLQHDWTHCPQCGAPI